MNLLTKIGQVAMKGLAILSGYGGLASALVPQASGAIQKVTSELSLFAGVVGDVQAFGEVAQIHGPDKLKMAAVKIEQVILDSAFMAGHKIADPALFKKAVEGYAQATVDFMQSLHGDGLQTESKT